MKTHARLPVVALLAACARVAAPPPPATAPPPPPPDTAAPSSPAPAPEPPDASAARAESALVPGVLVPVTYHDGTRRSRRVELAEVTVRHVDAAGVRFAVVELRCHDLVPRGGSDCWDFGYRSAATSIRAVDLASGLRLWDRRLPRFAGAYTAARVEGGALVLDAPSGAERFATADGAPLR